MTENWWSEKVGLSESDKLIIFEVEKRNLRFFTSKNMFFEKAKKSYLGICLKSPNPGSF